MFGSSYTTGRRAPQVTALLVGLDQAARKLGLSETVLVRLSQYFRVPQSAYEDVGSLSFTGELLFSDADLLFFGRVRDRIVMGDSLETIKSQVRRLPSGADTPTLPPDEDAAAIVGAMPPVYPPAALPWVSTAPPQEAVTPASPRHPQSAVPFRALAAQSFARYKQTRPPSVGSVFRSMAHRLAGSPSPSSPAATGKAPLSVSRVFSVGVIADTLRELFPQKPTPEDPMAMQALGVDPRHVYARGRVWPYQQSPNERPPGRGVPGTPMSVRGKAPSLAALSNPPGTLAQADAALREAALRVRAKALADDPPGRF